MARSTQRFVLASAVLLIGAAICAALIWRDIPERNEAILNVALGFVLGWGGAAVNFYFGTSEGSAHKSDILDRVVERPTGQPDDPVHVEGDAT